MLSAEANRKLWRWLGAAAFGAMLVAFVALELFGTSVLTAQRITGVALAVWFVALARSKQTRGRVLAASVVLLAVNVSDVAGVVPHLVAVALTLPLGLVIIWAPASPAAEEAPSF